MSHLAPSRRELSPLLAATLCLACSNGSGYGTGGVTGAGTSRATQGGTSGRAGATQGTSGSGSTSSATQGSTGSATQGSTGSTSGSASCDGGVTISWSVRDFCTQSTFTATAQVTNILDPSMTTNTDSSGAFSFCVAPGTPLDFQIVAPNHLPSVTQVFVPTVSEQIPQSPVLIYCQQAYSELAAALGGATPPFEQSESAVAVVIDPSQCNPAGWQVSLALPDGGAVPNLGVVYFSGTGVDPTATATGTEGGALIYDIDATLAEAAVVATQVDAGTSDGGCNYVGGAAPYQLSATFPIQQAGVIGFAIYPVQ